MWKRFSDWLQRVSSGWVTLAALLVFLLFTALVLPRQAARSNLDTGDAGSPDTSFYYTPADLYRFAEAYGEGGRRAYVRTRFTFDLVWPLVYGVFLATAISWVYGRGFAPGSRWQRANLMPVLGVLFDYLENVATSLVMLRYPAQTPVVDVLAPAFTMAKWVLIYSSFVLLLVGALVAVWKWRKRPDRQ
jgi:hypothetical protein